MPTLAESVARSLPTHPLVRTDMHITRAGFGAWAIGGGEDTASLELMEETPVTLKTWIAVGGALIGASIWTAIMVGLSCLCLM